MNPKPKLFVTALSGAFLTLTIIPVFAAPHQNYFMSGGTFCFAVGNSTPGNFEHLKLVVEPTSDFPPYKIVPVHALSHGMSVGTPYVDQYAGTATNAPSNDPSILTPVLQIALTGNGYGVTSVGEPEIWTFHYNLQLDPKTFNGKIYGVASESKPLVDGQPYKLLERTAVVRDLTRISCKYF